MKWLNLFLVFIFLSGFVAQAEEISLSLDEAVAIALRDNCDILLKAEEIKKTKAQISEARANLLPTVTLAGTLAKTNGLYSKGLSDISGQIGAKQIIYKGGKIINVIKSSEQKYIASEAILDKTKLETVYSVKKAFYALLLSDKFVELNKAIVGNTQEHLDLVKARFTSGQASQSDILSMQAALASVKEVYDISINQKQAAEEILNNLLFLNQDVKVRPLGAFIYKPQTIAYEQAALKALARRPEIRQLEAQKNIAVSNIEVAKADNRPQVYASWDYYSRQHLAGTLTKNWNDYNVMGVTISWPLFDGWMTKAKVQQAIVDLKEAQILKDKNFKDIVLELKTAYLELNNAMEKLQTVSEKIDVYDDSYMVIEEKYKKGLASGLDLNDAKLSYDVALFNQIQANYDYLVAKAKFDKAVGGQDEKDLQ